MLYVYIWLFFNIYKLDYLRIVYFLLESCWLKECLYLLQNTNDSPWQHCSNYFLENYQFIW